MGLYKPSYLSPLPSFPTTSFHFCFSRPLQFIFLFSSCLLFFFRSLPSAPPFSLSILSAFLIPPLPLSRIWRHSQRSSKHPQRTRRQRREDSHHFSLRNTPRSTQTTQGLSQNHDTDIRGAPVFPLPLRNDLLWL